MPLNDHGNVYYIPAIQDHRITGLQTLGLSRFPLAFLIQEILVGSEPWEKQR